VIRRLLWQALGLSLALVVVLAAIAFVQVGPIDVRGLASHPPGRTAMMHEREREARDQRRYYQESWHWVPLERVSATLRGAVLVAEDDKFFTHDGLDWDEIRISAQRNLHAHRIVRGGSTITQQLAKNLYLGEERTITRKLKEALLAVRLERALDKRRIFELYLNLIEWGPGVYGAEAAAHHWFGRSADSLTPREAALLAAIIINPRKFSPLDPPRRIERRTKMILDRMHRRGFLTEVQYAEALGLPPPSPSPAAAESSLAGAPSDSVTPPGSTSAPPEPAIETAPAPTPPDTVPVSPPAAP
jgi:monofunctional biosynthetic peptidoglycan transglycosylase